MASARIERRYGSILLLCLLLASFALRHAVASDSQVGQASRRSRVKSPVVDNEVRSRCQPVAFGAQSLDAESYLGRRVRINFRTGLLQTFSVHDYLDSYGKSPKWPTGEYLGKIMQGLSGMYLHTGEAAARHRLDKIIETWCRLQTDDGWLGTTSRFKSWDIWEHKYVLLGLLDYYALTGEERALNAARKIGDLYCQTIGPGLGDINQSGHWAMGSASVLEPMVYLYRFTDDPKYLRFCEYIVDSFESPTGPKLISILTTGSRRVCDIEDPFANRPAREMKFKNNGQIRNRSKGYEMLSCIIGLARMYQLTGKPEYLAVAVNAWEDISQHRLYLAGSSGADECFKDDHCLPAEQGDGPAEGCVTAHWIYLSRVLFEITGEVRYVDALEISLYNYLLASQRPQDCHQSYNTPMNGTKNFQRHDVKGAVGKAPCCLTSVMREIARTPEAIWTKFTSGGLGVLIYNGGTMEDTIQSDDGPVRVLAQIESSYPRSGNVAIRIQPKMPARFRVALRVPGWCDRFTARVGAERYTGAPGQFLDIERKWEGTETIRIELDLNTRLVSGDASYPGDFAFMHGPQVLTLVAGNGAATSAGEARVRASGAPLLKSDIGFLPQGWIGDQAYRTDALVGAAGCALVPFGDATQPGVSRECRTWIAAQPGTVPAPPDAPSGLEATALGKNRIRLGWTDHNRHEAGFRIERRRRDVGMWFHIRTTAPGVTECIDDSVNVVLPGKTYTYRVAAYNMGGRSAFSNEATATTPGVTVPKAPSQLKIAKISPTQIKLVWADNSDTEEGFRVECKIGDNDSWNQIAGRIPANLPAFTDYGLDSGQKYTYRVRAFNAAGDSPWSNVVDATTENHSTEAHAPKQPTEFFVSPAGDDQQGDGSLGRPWRSVARAQQAVRDINKNMTDDIVVTIRGGTYRLENELQFGERDSATNGHRITYRAHRDERPVLSGGVEVSGWQLHENGIYRASVPGLRFRQLYVDGRPEVRARHPNTEQPGAWESADYHVLIRYHLEGNDRHVIVERHDVESLIGIDGLEMVIASSWEQFDARVAEIELRGEEAAIRFRQPEQDRILGAPQTLRSRQTYYFENAYELLDAGGEWFLDTGEQTVYYKLRQGEDIDQLRIVVPKLQRILEVDGAEDIRFVGLDFAHATWLYPEDHGFVGRQSGSYNHYRFGLVPAGVRVANARNVHFERCRFTNMGGSGLTLAHSTHQTQIIGNVFANIASNGINVYERLKDADKSPADAHRCFQDVISNNYLCRCGLHYGGVGINATYATQTRIEHNELCDLPYSGMDLGWGSGADHQDYLVQRNRVHHVMRHFADGAGIYASEPQGHLRVQANFCHDIQRSHWAGPAPVAGLYLDQGISGSTWQRNVVRDCEESVHFNRHSGATEDNNVVRDTMSSNQEIEAAAGLEPSYREIKQHVVLDYPPSGTAAPTSDPWGDGFPPVADAKVTANSPDRNFGSSRQLTVQGRNREQHAYLRFLIPAFDPAQVGSITLRLIESPASTAVPADFSVCLVSGSWSEGELTWQNRPGPGRVLAKYRGVPGESDAVEIRLDPSAVNSDGTLGIVLVANKPGGDLNFASRESYLPPRLFVE